MAAVTGLLAALTLAAAPAARADTTVSIGRDHGRVTVDAAHQRLYVAGTSGVLVDDLDGKTIATLPIHYPAALSDDGKTLYGAEVDGNGNSTGIVAISTSTLQVTGRYPQGDVKLASVTAAGEGIAATGGKIILWGQRPGSAFVTMGFIDPADPQPSVDYFLSEDTSPESVSVFTSQAAPGVLVVQSLVRNSSQIDVYDMSGSAPVRTAHLDDSGPYVTGSLAFTPDGKDIVGAGPGELRLSDLSPVGGFPYAEAGAPGGRSSSYSADGAFAGTSRVGKATEVAVYAPGDTTPVRTYQFPFRELPEWTSGFVTEMTWGPDDRRLYVVTGDADVLDLHILDDPLTPSAVTSSDSPSDTPDSSQPPTTDRPTSPPADTATTPAAVTSSASPILARTGGGDGVSVLIGTAAALLALGGAAVVLTRRRRSARHG